MNRKNQTTSGRTCRTAPDITNTLDRLSLDLDQATQLAKLMDTELEKDGLQQVIHRAHQVTSIASTSDDDDDDDDDALSKLVETKKKLDLILTYLRYVHMFCYYCALECDSIEELNRRCLDPHTRKVPISGGISDSKQAAKNERMGK